MTKIAFSLLAGALVFASTVRGQTFTQSLRPEDFKAAGLAGLTAEQLAELNGLVERYKAGVLQVAQQKASAATAAQAKAEERAVNAEKAAKAAEHEAAEVRRNGGKGFLGRAVALLTPGTKIKYVAVESRIDGPVTGWGPKTVFRLENGQTWQVADYSSYFNGKPIQNPKVSIEPASLMGFRMTIEGIGSMRVRLLNGPIYQQN